MQQQRLLLIDTHTHRRLEAPVPALPVGPRHGNARSDRLPPGGRQRAGHQRYLHLLGGRLATVGGPTVTANSR
ncbi:hypothetical protein AB0H57_11045 [Micromonospora sp. NPDC050686]|uniref:hypothetical protein n=1 Tax=Micromonospora sp. NPDC050686 TaxID=3154631 RepID=UPI0033C8F368